MPLYNNRGSNMPQMAQAAMSSATSAMAHQQKQTTTTTKQKTSFWDDFYKAARGVAAGASAVNGIVDATGKAIDLYDEIKIKSAYDDIARTFGEGGYEAIQNNPNMQDYHSSQALGRFVKDRANTQQGYLDIMKKSDEAADRLYQNWRAQAMTVGEAYQSGNMDAYMTGMQQLVADSPMPYRLEPDGKGNFREMFRSDEAGGWTATGRTITPQAAYEQMNGMLRGEQMVLRGADMKLTPANAAFNQAASRYMYATMMGNAENRTDPKKQVPLYDRKGNVAGIGVIQNPLDNYSAGPKLVAFGINGKQLGVFDGYDQAMAHGLSPFAPQKGKAGRGGRGGGGRGRGGSGTNADGALANSEYKLTQGDTSMLAKYATRIDADTGEKSTDYGTVSFLAGVMRKTGLDAPSAIAAYDTNVKRAMAQGASREQAEAAVMSAMQGRINGQKQQASQQTQQQAAQAEEGKMPPKTSVVDSRIRSAAGVNAPDDNDYRVPSSPAAGLGAGFSQDERSAPRPTSEEGSASNDPTDINLIWQNTATGRKPYVVTKNGAVEISQEEANDIVARQKAAPSVLEKVWKNKRPPTKRVTYADVENELSAEEKEHFRKTGKLPGRYNQAR